MHSLIDDVSPNLYRSSFIAWDSLASVRAKPRRILQPEDSLNKLFWIPELAPISTHPLIIEKGLSPNILIQHLYLHLDFTIRLEQDIVNYAVYQLAHGKVNFVIPEEMAIDAYKIYCDEAYHALLYADFKLQVKLLTGVEPILHDNPIFLKKLRAIQLFQTEELSKLIEIFFVIVSETLISSVLSKVPKNTNIITPVREIIYDHACDEAYHRIYFSSLFALIWKQLDKHQQLIIGQLLPDFIKIFLEPDFASLNLILSSFDLTPEDIQTVITASYPTQKLIESIRSSAKNTLTLLWKNGVFENPQTLEFFRINNLLPEELSNNHKAKALNVATNDL